MTTIIRLGDARPHNFGRGNHKSEDIDDKPLVTFIFQYRPLGASNVSLSHDASAKTFIAILQAKGIAPRSLGSKSGVRQQAAKVPAREPVVVEISSDDDDDAGEVEASPRCVLTLSLTQESLIASASPG